MRKLIVTVVSCLICGSFVCAFAGESKNIKPVQKQTSSVKTLKIKKQAKIKK